MKRIVSAFWLFTFLAGSLPGAFGLTVEATAPKTGYSILDDLLEDLADDLVDDANDELKKYGNQPLLARGIGNANVYASQVANQRARQGYRLIDVTLGTMFGIQLPGINPTELQASLAELQDSGDIHLGVAWQAWAVHVGINAGFLLENLYLGAQFGKFAFEELEQLQGLSFNALNIGLTGSYQLIEDKKILLGLLRWRGLSVGTGAIFQTNNTLVTVPIDTLKAEISQDFGLPVGEVTGTVTLDPTIEIGMSAWSLSIPIEVFTGLRVLWLLELTLGAGVDLSFGSSETILRALGESNFKVDSSAITIKPKAGTIIVDGGTTGYGPAFFRPRIMLGVGLNLGPVFLEFPVTFYIPSGFHMGLNLGLVF